MSDEICDSQYTFIRVDGFYVLSLKNDHDAILNAAANSGTIQVINDDSLQIIWSLH